jgi:hypothetical protein
MMDEAQLRRFAERTIRGSRHNVRFGIIATVAVEAFEILARAGIGVHASVLAILALSLAYNTVRIRAARRAIALGTLEALRKHLDDQKRSHLLRGRIFLVAAPVLVVGTSVATLLTIRSADRPALYVCAVVVATLFLGRGWFWWRRALRQVAKWSA